MFNRVPIKIPLFVTDPDTDPALLKFQLVDAPDDDNGDFVGVDSFTYIVSDGVDESQASVLINVMLEAGFIGGLLLIAMFLRQFWDMVFRPNIFPDAVTALVLVGGLGDLVMFNAMPKSQTLIWLIALYWRQLAGSTSERTGGSCK